MIRDLMIGGASVEDMLTLWASSLREAKQRMRPLFTQERVAISAGQFFDGLLGNEPRKTGWMRAETAGDKGPWRQQAILGRGSLDDFDIYLRHYFCHSAAKQGALIATIGVEPQQEWIKTDWRRNHLFAAIAILNVR